MKKISLLTIFSLLTASLMAQSSFSKHQLEVNYFGETLTHAGASVIYNYIIHQKEKSKTTQKGKVKTHFIQYHSANRVAFYVHPRNHNGWLVTSGLYIQRSKKSGWFIGAGLQAGYQLKLLNENTYQINNGIVERVRWNSQSAFVTGFGTRLGKDFSLKNPDNRFGWQINSSIIWSSPFSVNSQLISFIKLGVSYDLQIPSK
jgi:hypothetical protein